MPPPQPYPVTGKVFDTDGSTGLSGATVTIVNLRTTESLEATSEADGSYAIDLQNLPGGWNDGDDLLFIARKVISAMAEKFAQDTSSISGTTLTKNLTVVLYVDKQLYPLEGIDNADSKMRVFDPQSQATRIVPVTPDGVRYHLIGKRTSDTTWDLMLPDGTQFGEVDASGNLKITGEISVLQTF